MEAVPLVTEGIKSSGIFGAHNFVQMGENEKPPVEEVVSFARANGATYLDPKDNSEVFLVKPCDESVFCGMNEYTLNAALTL